MKVITGDETGLIKVGESGKAAAALATHTLYLCNTSIALISAPDSRCGSDAAPQQPGGS
jgi:hypothetical protein